MIDRDSYLIQEAYDNVKLKELTDFFLKYIPKDKLEMTSSDAGDTQGHHIPLDKAPFTLEDIVNSYQYSDTTYDKEFKEANKELISMGKIVDIKKVMSYETKRFAGNRIYYARVVYPSFDWESFPEGHPAEGAFMKYDFNKPLYLSWIIYHISPKAISGAFSGDYSTYSPFKKVNSKI
jgi:hypothetical protein